MSKGLILGVGNSLMGDEGVGCQAVAHLEKSGLFPQFDFLGGGTGGFHLMEHLIEHDPVILIDATLDDRPEGTVRLIKPSGYRDFPSTMSTHEIGLKDLITSLTLIDQLPNMFLIAVSVKDYAGLSLELSETIANTFPKIEQAIHKVELSLAKDRTF
ncbi:MAG: hydrogenase maturation protease [Flavobacteriales bacterium]|nr:hydrogenase maturation protease [Flavobacteriales bacterium]